MNHVMLDLETFGTQPGSVIRSIGAVEFALTGAMGRTYYANISSTSCTEAGLKIDPATADWWKRQSQQAQEALLVDPIPLKQAVIGFAKWFTDIGVATVWSHGAAFDTVLWDSACRAIGGPAPWKFFNVRDTRTVFDLFDFDIRDILRDGTYHNALDDAKYQVRCVAAALAKGRPAVAAGVFG